jgi:hypothetical protein
MSSRSAVDTGLKHTAVGTGTDYRGKEAKWKEKNILKSC